MRVSNSNNIGLAFLAFLLLCLAGCGKQKIAVIKGNVTCEGKPVLYGSVSIAGIGKDRSPRSAMIQKDGTYTVEGVPFGEAQIAVQSIDPSGRSVPWTPMQKDPKVRKGWIKSEPKSADNTGWFPVPAEYGEFAKSGLTLTVDKEAIVHNIELKDKEGNQGR